MVPVQRRAGLTGTTSGSSRLLELGDACGKTLLPVRQTDAEGALELAAVEAGVGGALAASVGYSAVVMGITGTCGAPSRAPARTIARGKAGHVVSPPAAM